MGYLSLAVAQFTDCRATWTDVPGYQRCIKFQGDETDLEYCAWLFKRFRDEGYAESKKVPGNARETFRKAYALRLRDRMQTLKREQEAALRQAVTATGTALMVVQNKIALRDAEFGRQKIRHSRAHLGSYGFSEGRAAADRATFNRPIGQAQRQLS